MEVFGALGGALGTPKRTRFAKTSIFLTVFMNSGPPREFPWGRGQGAAGVRGGSARGGGAAIQRWGDGGGGEPRPNDRHERWTCVFHPPHNKLF